MKKYLLPVLLFLFLQPVKASDKDSTIHYDLPDSVKAVQFMAEMTVGSFNIKKNCDAGIGTDAVSLSLRNNKGSRGFYFSTAASFKNVKWKTPGINAWTDLKDQDMIFKYDWQINETYKFLISIASDSAGNFSLYSGYIFLPKENKWKLIGTCKIAGRWNTLQTPASFYSAKNIQISMNQVWCQRQNGSWRNMSERTPSEKNETLPNPVVNLFGHVDSVQQRQTDIKLIEDAIASGKTDVKENIESVYYKMMKEGTGRLVSVNDTLTVFYKGYLFANDSVFDQTKEKPATFPLKRLIRAWQLAIPLCRIGGKIKIVIPSDLAYSIRTRAAKIPPNSILVFEIEVLDAKSPQAGN